MVEDKGDETLPAPRPEGAEARGMHDTSLIITKGHVIAERYEILESLGQGGMGAVYRARDRVLEREVAVKLLPVPETHLVGRFRAEAKTLAALTHPHVVPIYDFGITAHGAPFLVMRLLSGESLADRIAAINEGRATLSRRQRTTLLMQVAWALRDAHAIGVVHRDLKPANIMLVATKGDDDRESESATLIDFGLVKKTGHSGEVATAISEDSDPALTQDGIFMGTPLYASPEQLAGEELRSATDWWSFGAVAFELLTGTRLLPEGSSRFAALTHDPILADHPELLARLPIVLQDFLSGLLRKNPETRMTDANRIIRALAEWEAMDAVRAWRRIVHHMKTIERELVHLERTHGTSETAEQYFELGDALRACRRDREKGEEPIAFEAAKLACLQALDREPRPTRTDRESIARRFVLPALRDAERRRNIGREGQCKTLLYLVYGCLEEERVQRILTREERVVVTSNPVGANVFCSRYTLDGVHKVREGKKFVGRTPCEITLPRDEQWSLTLECEGYRSITDDIRGCGIRTPVLSYTFFTEEEIGGAAWVHIPGGVFPLGGDVVSTSSRSRRLVRLPDFFMQRAPVTQEEFARMLHAVPRKGWFARLVAILITLVKGEHLTPFERVLKERKIKAKDLLPMGWTSFDPSHPKAPIVGISPIAAFVYVDWLSYHMGDTVLLPSEDEIEAAIRGPQGNFFAWGDEFDKHRVANVSLGITTIPDVGAYTPDGTPPGIDVSWCGIRNSALVSTFCRKLEGDILLQKMEEGRVAARTGGNWQNAERMFLAATRLRFPFSMRSQYCGIRGVRYPRRP